MLVVTSELRFQMKDKMHYNDGFVIRSWTNNPEVMSSNPSLAVLFTIH